MNVVVTGSNGFVGRRVVRGLSLSGHVVTGVGSSPSPEISAHSRYHCSNLDDPGTLLPDDRDDDRFLLVHLAWDMHHRSALRANAQHVARLVGLLEYWENRGLAGVVVAGSADEFGQRSGRLNDDDQPLGQLSAYGCGKRAAHDFCRTWAQQTGTPVTWLRPFVVYGPGQQGDMVIPYALRQAMSGAEAEFSDGLQVRDFVYVDDVADAFCVACSTPGAGFRELNIGTGQGVRIRDVVETIAASLGARQRFRFGVRQRRMNEPDDRIAAVGRAREELGWSARTSWREGIDRVIDSARRGYAWTA